MTRHLLVDQLRFSRSELMRCMEGLTAEEAKVRLGQMNSIGWIICHLAHQERNYWVLSQGKDAAPDVAKCGWGQPASTPELEDALGVWRAVTDVADQFLDTLAPSDLLEYTEQNGQRSRESIGTRLLRNIMHYWFHLGEAHAIRQHMGHKDLPQFVGDMSNCLYRTE